MPQMFVETLLQLLRLGAASSPRQAETLALGRHLPRYVAASSLQGTPLGTDLALRVCCAAVRLQPRSSAALWQVCVQGCVVCGGKRPRRDPD